MTLRVHRVPVQGDRELDQKLAQFLGKLQTLQEKPVSVCANGACHVGNGHENVAYLTVYFDSGLIAHFHNNWLSPVKVRTMLVGGSKKTIHYDDM
jgi:hypothetical protein